MTQDKPKRSGQEHIYRIKVKETLNHPIVEWFDALTILPLENGETLMVGLIVDQVALRSLLEHLWNLNLTIISIERIGNEN